MNTKSTQTGSRQTLDTSWLARQGANLLRLADVGMAFAKDGYDHERYDEIRQIGLELLAGVTGQSTLEVDRLLPINADYPTAKVDVRGVTVHQGKWLLVREKADGLWTPPGGWADAGYTPTEHAVKETGEEAGLEVEAVRLLGVSDKTHHGHPPSHLTVYKIYVLCRPVSPDRVELTPGHETLGAEWFSPDDLPSLSLERFTPELVTICRARIEDPSLPPFID